MKVLTILGSPQKNGQTAKTLDMLEGNLISQGHEVERIRICDHNIKGCIGCHACMGINDRPGCIQKDDAIAIFERMITADAIVYASPIYCYDFTSQFKTLIDRHWCLTINFGSPGATSSIAGKRVALLITCGGNEADNADLAKEIFDRSIKNGMKCNIVGKYTIQYSGAPDFEERARRTAEEIARDLIEG
jgi:multimeric flavodoxin WrbA